MEEKLVSFIQKHQLIQKNKTVLVGVSGGPDSIALLHLLTEWRKEWQLHVIAISIDHQLRGEDAKEDVRYVQTMCKKWDVPFVAIAVDVEAYKRKHKVSTQVAARELRYATFQEQMAYYNGDYLALGHHGDDQIETMIMSLVRTTNLSSLAGIPFKRKFSCGEIIRPLLCVTKSEIEYYCVQHELQARIDATNEDTYYTRNYIRKYIVPKLKERNDNLHTTIQRLSESLQEDEQYLMEQAKKIVHKTIVFHENEQRARLSIPTLKKYPISLQRRIYRLTLDYLYNELPENLSYTHEQIFFSLLHAETGNQVLHFPKEFCIEKSYDTIFFYFNDQSNKDKPFHHVIHDIPEMICLPNGASLSVSLSDEKGIIEIENNRYTYICPVKKVSFPLHIRSRKDGDRMHYEGLQGTKKVKDILIDAKVPRHLREQTYLLTDDSGEIFWLIGLRKNKGKNISSNRYLVFEYQSEPTS